LVAVADVAYANGADPAMIPQLLAGVDVRELCGFAAWNTAGNTLGTVVAQAAMVHLAKVKGLDSNKLLDDQILFRLLEDYVYQTVVRQKVRAEVKDDAPDLLIRVEETLLVEVASFLRKTSYEKDYECEVSGVFLPWNRTFEIGFELLLKVNSSKDKSMHQTAEQS
jgi:Protein of unknown function (DUF4127)